MGHVLFETLVLELCHSGLGESSERKSEKGRGRESSNRIGESIDWTSFTEWRFDWGEIFTQMKTKPASLTRWLGYSLSLSLSLSLSHFFFLFLCLILGPYFSLSALFHECLNHKAWRKKEQKERSQEKLQSIGAYNFRLLSLFLFLFLSVEWKSRKSWTWVHLVTVLSAQRRQLLSQPHFLAKVYFIPFSFSLSLDPCLRECLVWLSKKNIVPRQKQK